MLSIRLFSSVGLLAIVSVFSNINGLFENEFYPPPGVTLILSIVIFTVQRCCYIVV